MYPGHWARETPDKAAAVNARTGAVLTYAELDAGSNRIANWLADHGVVPGDHVALFMENDLRFFEIAWAAFRSGLYITCINRYLTAEEAAYIIDDCGARVVFSSGARADVAADLKGLCPLVEHWLIAGGELDGWLPLETTVADSPTVARGGEPAGDSMLYSSGTTASGPCQGPRSARDCATTARSRVSTGSTNTASICRPRPCITPPPSPSAWAPSPSAGPC
jgi:fatty-acyl-CoA synthase